VLALFRDLMPRISPCFSLVALLCLSGCSTKPRPAPAIGEAFIAPATLNLHGDLSPRSPVVAELKHGERVEVLQVRRRFVKIRAGAGAEGWTDNRQLLTPRQMGSLKKMIETAQQLPSQGRGTIGEPLNVHTEPNRQAPSFFQVPENGSVEVVGRVVLPRVPFRGDVVVPPPPSLTKKTRKAAEKREKSESGIPPPPAPKPPKVPDNWLDLSRRTPLPGDQEPETPQQKLDEWALVRTKEGNAGWVLARMVSMAIPDEVAQYAEGARITSYFALGDVTDRDGNTRHNWLWTTLSKPLETYEFDSFRVFVFSTRRNHYETAYIEKNVKGYYPAQTRPVEVTEGKKRLTVLGFSIISEDKNGAIWRRTFAFQGYHIRVISKEPWKRTPPVEVSPAPEPSFLTQPVEAAEKQAAGLWERLKGTVRGWFGKK